MVADLIDKYVWLIQLLSNAGLRGLTLEEIAISWKDRYGTEYPRRTFNNHRDAVAELFGVEINCDRKTNRYSLSEVTSDKKQTVDWLINTFSVNSLLSIGKEKLSGRVLVEDVPSGHRFLTRIMQAMIDGKEIAITYRKYTSSEVELFHVHPYAVKEYERRWYLVGYCVEREGLRLYGMDRILDLLYSGKSFVMPKDLDIREKFVFSFGPYLPEGKPQIIRLKAFGTEALFLKDLPLHESQTLVSEDEEGAVFRLYLIPTRNFVMELCRHGARIEVLEPLSLRDEVAAEHERALYLYRGPDLVLE